MLTTTPAKTPADTVPARTGSSGFRFSYAWGRPDLPCPGPRVLLTVEALSSRIPEEIERIWKPGTGYVVRVEPLAANREPVRWSTEAKARVRRRNLMKRLQHRVPLFAHQFYEAELSNRRNYFSGL
ncbi:theronine dehydrogenase (plasmid) [Cereibacter azotoformans]|uniref:theronine dehydrogenase n=1 Tax=Cereibacter azotoformans TaxID=43057 RepID=UPI001EEA3684|nr:theronine dehydrogenase [Cereibacter azotoformans]ULB12547.1 theronine dehydrogenase [Cereibacter azotoformans]